MPAHRLDARWLLTMDGPPIEGGAVLIDAGGRLEAVGPGDSVPLPEGALESSFPDAVILPGLINTHTHLELTGFAGLVADPDFAPWIRSLRTLKAARSRDAFLEAARDGVRRCFAAGVTTVADTGDSGVVMQALAEAGGSGIVYQEVFGPHPDQVRESMNGLVAHVAELRTFESDRLRLGVSPHAPYTVSGLLYEAVARFARDEHLPVAVHIAESKEETELVTRGRGPFAEAWRGRGIPGLDVQAGGAFPRSSVAWLDRHGVLAPETLCIHAVQLDPADVALLALRGAAVAHCPCSNRAHRHGDAPIAALLAAGIRVGVGTDSEVSGKLDLMADVRLARRLAALSADAALGLVTRDAAGALGIPAGRLVPGAMADLVVHKVRGVDGGSMADALLDQWDPAVGLVGTWIGGRRVYRAGHEGGVA
ncbi:MAG: amidohydrolase family protein [Gemmatimonadota bacterium]